MLACSAQCRKFQDLGLWQREICGVHCPGWPSVAPFWADLRQVTEASLNLSFLTCNMSFVCLSMGVGPLIFIIFRLGEKGSLWSLLCFSGGGAVHTLLYPLSRPHCMKSPSWSWCPLKAGTYLFLVAVLSKEYGSSARGEVLGLVLCNFQK